jgi:hypothetical protein
MKRAILALVALTVTGCGSESKSTTRDGGPDAPTSVPDGTDTQQVATGAEASATNDSAPNDAAAPTTPVTLASGQGNPLAIAVDGTGVYWTTLTDPGNVMKVVLGGGGPVTLASGQRFPVAISVSAGTVYWANRGLTGGSGAVGTGGIMRIAADGTGSPTSVASSLTYVTDLAVNASAAFFLEYGTDSVKKVGLAGGAVTSLASAHGPFKITLDGSFAYWTNDDDGKLMRVPLAGGTATAMSAAAGHPYDVAVDASFIYYSASAASAVSKIPLAGSGSPVDIASGQSGYVDLALDATAIYWIRRGSAGRSDGAVMKARLSGGGPITLASGQPAPAGIAIDGTCVYWTNAEGGTVMKVAK